MISIKEISEPELDSVMRIQESTNLSHWSKSDYFAEIDNRDSIFLVAGTETETFGFILLRLIGTANSAQTGIYEEAEILNIAVETAWQRQGLAGLLINTAFDRMRPISVQTVCLEVRESNLKAIRFYQRFGFLKDYCRTNYYNEPVEDAIVMKKTLEIEESLAR